jgi:hypothetical protein
MKETAKALVRNNKHELPAARILEVSLDRADNVIEGGPPTTPVKSERFSGGGLDAALPTSRASAPGTANATATLRPINF